MIFILNLFHIPFTRETLTSKDSILGKQNINLPIRLTDCKNDLIAYFRVAEVHIHSDFRLGLNFLHDLYVA